MDTKKICPKCGKKRVVSISDALKIKTMSKAEIEKEFCTCG